MSNAQDLTLRLIQPLKDVVDQLKLSPSLSMIPIPDYIIKLS
jgi:hypothetical protein